MKRKYRFSLWPFLLSGLLLLGACQTEESAGESATNSATESTDSTDSTGTASSSTTSTATISTSDLFSDRDLDPSYDESEAVSIQFDGDTVTCSSSAVTISDGTVTITAEGVYRLSGTWEEGQVLIDAGESDKVQLVLDTVSITSATSAAIYAKEADKVFITLADGSENTLINGGEYVAIDDNNIDAVIFAKTDLTLNGSGQLTVEANAGHGIVSKDDLTITGGTYQIDAASHGITGKDSLSVADGTFQITSGKDGLRAENTDDTSLGSIYLAGGTYQIESQGDAISASGALQIDGGTFTLTTGGGSASVTMDSGDTMGFGQRPGSASDSTTEDETDSVSQKGVKADGTITINGGDFTTDTADDSIHAGGAIQIAAGTFALQSGDDAIHSDDAVAITDGTFTIPYCYEGIEGLSITIDGGSFDITSQDDGLNAAGGADSSGFGGGFAPDSFASSDSCIVINGGTLTVTSSGDCIDSNGDLTLNGGTLTLTCNGNGDTALDCDGTYTNNGGDITTNDGSESNPGAMTGGGKGAGQGGGGMTGGTPPSGNPGGNQEMPSI